MLIFKFNAIKSNTLSQLHKSGLASPKKLKGDKFTKAMLAFALPCLLLMIQPIQGAAKTPTLQGTPVEAVANVTMAEGILNHKEPGTEAIAAGIATWFSNKTESNSNTYGGEEGEGWESSDRRMENVAPLSL
ncbi:hypothetical protein PVK06_040219 [Gossypium arboreum]|uniref:Uncharacterized protein n=1 Tax=Gossypium arboreum TaxID=29729 RepID=A0ABR0N4X1_GOSAR|nr:hypothetical protein PVK06_040219 [Gossypium arboreum]